jgi:DNA-directed RNA polymerase subunit RPC12/RpoP
MSSSHRKKAPTSDALACPECGKTQMIRVVETCRLADGLTVKKLGHYKCRSCGSRFFDDDAMHGIQAARASHRSLAKSC